MAQVLVTGGAGFIGSHLVDALLARGDQVRVLDNFSSGKRQNLAAAADHIDMIEGDVRDAEAVTKAVAGVETVFHQAAFVSVPASLEKPRECFAINVTGTLELLEAARQANVQQVVLASSTAIYGEPEEMPVSEERPPHCLSPYAASKLADEHLAQVYSQGYGLPVVALRYFNVYGTRQAPDSDYAAVLPRFIQRLAAGQPPHIHGDGRQTRDFIHVADVVRANLLAADAPEAAGRAFNVCSGRETNLLDIVDVLSHFFPDAPPAEFGDERPGDVRRSVGDPDLAARHLGFRAQISLHDGLKHTVEAMAA